MIAYISPLIPKRTGIALYSHHLIQALQQALAEVGDSLVVFDDDVVETNLYQSDYKAKEILPLIFEKKQREKYSQFIYHFGNNPFFHLPMLHLLQRQKGIVVLHDSVLYYLIAGQESGGLWKALTRQSSTRNNIDLVNNIIDDSPEKDILRYSSPANYAFLQEVLLQATAVVVHSKMAKDYVVNANFNGPIYQVPLIDYQQPTAINDSIIENNLILNLVKQKSDANVFIIGVFGFAGETKRGHSIFQALSELSTDVKARLKLMIIGNDHYQTEINAMGLSDIVVNVGYVNESDYDCGMAICDLIINLRYPSMGETSAVQIQAMSAEKATIVSNNGWFGELHNNTVHKISVGGQEVEELKQAIVKIMDDDNYRLSVAHKAKEYIEKEHSPDQVAKKWMDVISKSYLSLY